MVTLEESKRQEVINSLPQWLVPIATSLLFIGDKETQTEARLQAQTSRVLTSVEKLRLIMKEIDPQLLGSRDEVLDQQRQHGSAFSPEAVSLYTLEQIISKLEADENGDQAYFLYTNGSYGSSRDLKSWVDLNSLNPRLKNRMDSQKLHPKAFLEALVTLLKEHQVLDEKKLQQLEEWVNEVSNEVKAPMSINLTDNLYIHFKPTSYQKHSNKVGTYQINIEIPDQEGKLEERKQKDAKQSNLQRAVHYIAAQNLNDSFTRSSRLEVLETEGLGLMNYHLHGLTREDVAQIAASLELGGHYTFSSESGLSAFSLSQANELEMVDKDNQVRLVFKVIENEGIYEVRMVFYPMPERAAQLMKEKSEAFPEKFQSVISKLLRSPAIVDRSITFDRFFQEMRAGYSENTIYLQPSRETVVEAFESLLKQLAPELMSVVSHSLEQMKQLKVYQPQTWFSPRVPFEGKSVFVSAELELGKTEPTYRLERAL